MKTPAVWIDLANTPHVPFFAPIVASLQDAGFEVTLTARDHSQTAELAKMVWPEVAVVGRESPSGLAGKGRQFADRVGRLQTYCHRIRPDVALSHGSYSQVVAARLARVPAVTMMDYEHQPANHLSFRAATAVIVPRVFPVSALRRFGARRKAHMYDGFKEEVYLAALTESRAVLTQLDLADTDLLVVMRPAPEGALYHRHFNERFETVVSHVLAHPSSRLVLLPRNEAQRTRYSQMPGITVPRGAVDGQSLLAAADLVVGAGGTMNREAALLGVPTYTVFDGKLAAVDAELLRLGLLNDLRAGTMPLLQKKTTPDRRQEALEAGRKSVLSTVLSTVRAVMRTA